MLVCEWARPYLTNLANNGPDWARLDQIGPLWTTVDNIGPLRTNTMDKLEEQSSEVLTLRLSETN